ncbi:hypothetical protein ADIAG_03020 [Paeniglutamicibacter gangotriensis Lz1y]|uniref:HNH nuclease domain-containing protein n=2 Tax=Paeniglutamicibacter gangotriensis TaxID=254787 RepID=M7MRS3_9MICC|nr:hypothetical protein ADIAG_03020 [Paeniglutamicibacter gangotriensis Lz1y]
MVRAAVLPHTIGTLAVQIHHPGSMLLGMGTFLSASHSGPANTAELGQELAATSLALSAATGSLAQMSLDGASAATVMGLLERVFRTVAYAQLVITRRAAAVEVHRLDPVTAQQIDELVAAPEHLAAGSAAIPAEALRQGMAPHRNIQAYMQAHLHISAADARRRITGGKLLVAPVPPIDPHGTIAEPSYPVLARAAADGSADVANLASAAGRLQSMQPRIQTRPDAGEINTAIEESVAQEARTAEPKMCDAALRDWGGFLAENGTPLSDEEIRARRGMFFRGFRDGSDEYTLRCDPMDSEVILSFGEAWTNPRSAKTPPRSISNTSRPGEPAAPPSTPAASPPRETEDESFAPTPTSASGTPTFSPAGVPAPEWAIPAGTTGDAVPLSELACGLPPEGYGPDGIEDESARTSPQLLLDAVIAAMAGVLNATEVSETGGLRPRIGLLIDYRSLLGLCEQAGLTDHNQPISAASVRRYACDADILPAVMGEEGQVLDLGREVRGFTKAQRRAIAIRDRGCIIPACKHPAATCECHHVLPWQKGGATSVANSALLCEYHHTQVHAGLITLKSFKGIPYVVEMAGKPCNPPQRNLLWHPELRTLGYQPRLFEGPPGTDTG